MWYSCRAASRSKLDQFASSKTKWRRSPCGQRGEDTGSGKKLNATVSQKALSMVVIEGIISTHVKLWYRGNFSFLRSAYKYRRRQWHPTPVLLPGKSHGWRSLVGFSPWGREESDPTERLHFPFYFPALEKEMAAHSSVLAWRIPGMGEPGGLPSNGVTQSQTRLKQLSSIYIYITVVHLKV